MAIRTASPECECGGGPHLTFREVEVLKLAAGGLSSAQIGRRLDIGKHTVDDHFSSVLQRSHARSRSEAIARAYAAGIFVPGEWPPQWSKRTCLVGDGDLDQACPESDSEIVGSGSEILESPARHRPATDDIVVRVGCLRVSEPDRIAGAMRELLELLGDEIGPQQANSNAIPGIRIEIPAQDAGDRAGETLILATMPKDPDADAPGGARPATEDPDRPAPGEAGRPRVLAAAMLAGAAERRACGESVDAIARDLRIGRSTLYRALRSHQARGTAPLGTALHVVTAALPSGA